MASRVCGWSFFAHYRVSPSITEYRGLFISACSRGGGLKYFDKEADDAATEAE